MKKSIIVSVFKITGLLFLLVFAFWVFLRLLPFPTKSPQTNLNAVYPPPDNTPTQTSTPVPYPPPGKLADKTATPPIILVPSQVAPPKPPEGWPTGQPWPLSREVTRIIYPSRTPFLYPTPVFPPSPSGKAPANLQALWYPLYFNSLNSPRIEMELIDDVGQRWGKGPMTIELPMGPGFGGSTLFGLFPSPDGNWMIGMISSGEGIASYLINLSTGKANLLIPNDPNFAAASFLTWEPDSLKVIAQLIPMEPNSVAEVDILSGKYQTLEFPKEKGAVLPIVSGLAYSPDGNSIAEVLIYPPTENYNTECLLNIGIRDIKTQERKIVKEITSACGLAMFSLQWSADGQYLSWIALETLKGEPVLGRNQAELWVMNNSNGEAKPLIILAKNVEALSSSVWSPDSKKIAYLKYNESDVKFARGNIVLIDPNSGVQTQISHFSNLFISNLVWSKNSQRIFCSVYDELSGAVWAVSLDGSTSLPVAGPILARSAFSLMP